MEVSQAGRTTATTGDRQTGRASSQLAHVAGYVAVDRPRPTATPTGGPALRALGSGHCHAGASHGGGGRRTRHARRRGATRGREKRRKTAAEERRRGRESFRHTHMDLRVHTTATLYLSPPTRPRPRPHEVTTPVHTHTPYTAHTRFARAHTKARHPGIQDTAHPICHLGPSPSHPPAACPFAAVPVPPPTRRRPRRAPHHTA